MFLLRNVLPSSIRLLNNLSDLGFHGNRFCEITRLVSRKTNGSRRINKQECSDENYKYISFK